MLRHSFVIQVGKWKREVPEKVQVLKIIFHSCLSCSLVSRLHPAGSSSTPANLLVALKAGKVYNKQLNHCANKILWISHLPLFRVLSFIFLPHKDKVSAGTILFRFHRSWRYRLESTLTNYSKAVTSLPSHSPPVAVMQYGSCVSNYTWTSHFWSSAKALGLFFCIFFWTLFI